jgi:hypothetical protein
MQAELLRYVITKGFTPPTRSGTATWRLKRDDGTERHLSCNYAWNHVTIRFEDMPGRLVEIRHSDDDETADLLERVVRLAEPDAMRLFLVHFRKKQMVHLFAINEFIEGFK